MDIYMFLKPPISDKENYIKKKISQKKNLKKLETWKDTYFDLLPLLEIFAKNMLRVQLASDNKVSQISL